MRPIRRPRKYHNEPVYIDGERFDSRAEARRWGVLQLGARAGLLTNLRRQVRLPLSVDGTVIGHYVADFAYEREGRPVYEDVKGVRTPLYCWKAKHVAAEYGTQIVEIPA